MSNAVEPLLDDQNVTVELGESDRVEFIASRRTLESLREDALDQYEECRTGLEAGAPLPDDTGDFWTTKEWGEWLWDQYRAAGDLRRVVSAMIELTPGKGLHFEDADDA